MPGQKMARGGAAARPRAIFIGAALECRQGLAEADERQTHLSFGRLVEATSQAAHWLGYDSEGSDEC